VRSVQVPGRSNGLQIGTVHPATANVQGPGFQAESILLLVSGCLICHAATAVWVAANSSVLYLCVLQPAVPVWRQVRRMCDHSPECTRALRAQVEELQQEVARLRRKLPAIMVDQAWHERDAADFEFESDSWEESDSLEED
jgi:hypothetical protein